MSAVRHTLRQAMDFVHTWIGVAFSVLLFLVFFMGTLSVFDQEIDRWMLPETRLAPVETVSFDRQIRPALETLAPPDVKQWFVSYPSERSPVVRVGWRQGKEFVTRQIDPRTGEVLPEAGSWGGTGFFFPFHYSFHIKWMDVGYWMLAIVSIGMLALLVSGVIIHKKIFTDLFTFRPDKSRHRVTLDVHNICGVLILPFHFLITFSGLVIFLMIYFKPAVPLLFGNEAPKANQEIFDQYSRPSLKVPGVLGPVDPLVEKAQEIWGGGNIRNLQIVNPRDKNVVVQVLRRPDDRVSYSTLTIAFDGQTGEVLNQQTTPPVAGVQRFFSGLHMIPLAHWGIRWLYFVMGLGGCTLIATGLLLWVDKREVRQIKEGRRSYRVMHGLACAGTMGVVLATLAMLVANRILPAMDNRPAMEAWVYFGVWTLTLAHAAWRSRAPLTRRAWFEQATGVAVLAITAVILNAMTTGDNLVSAMLNGQWSVAGVDAILLLTAILAAISVRRYFRKAALSQTAKRKTLEPAESMS